MKTAVNPNMIILAREARGLSQTDLAEKINIHKANVSRLEKGDTNIQEPTLMAISAATCFPPQFFMQDGAPMPVNLAYRKRQNVPLKTITPIEAKMNIIRRHVQFITKSLDIEVFKLPIYEVTEDQKPARIAEMLKKQWNLKDGVIDNMVEILEAKSIVISTFDFGTERVDSRSMLTDDKQPIIFVNKNLLGDRLRYSLAYELGQLIMHTFSPVPADRNVSREANEFASAFLMSESEVLKDFENGVTFGLLADLKRKWKVSMISLLYRADDLGLLTPNQKRYLIQQFNEQKIRRREPVELDVPIEHPTLLKKLINRYINDYEIGKEAMAAILAISIHDYVEYYG